MLFYFKSFYLFVERTKVPDFAGLRVVAHKISRPLATYAARMALSCCLTKFMSV